MCIGHGCSVMEVTNTLLSVPLPRPRLTSRFKHPPYCAATTRALQSSLKSLRASPNTAAAPHTTRKTESEEEREEGEEEEDEDQTVKVDPQAETLGLLEWPALCEQISTFCSTPMAITAAQNSGIPIGSSQLESQLLQEQTSAAGKLNVALDFTSAWDVRGIVERTVTKDTCRVPELCHVRDTLECAQTLSRQLSEAGDKSREIYHLQEIITGLELCRELREDITRCLDGRREIVLDTASSKLAQLRRQRRDNMNQLENLLKETGRKVVEAGGIDTVTVTSRRARLCIAVRSTHKFLLAGGVVLDSSNTGATLFIEPEPALRLNNVEIRLSSAEKAEETAVLKRLTEKVAEHATDILALLRAITLLDFACARAKHARWLGGVKPEFCSGEDNNRSVCIRIENIQHPLLLGAALQHGKNVPVAVDIKVNSGVKVVIISGPNTGGKTVALKTLGLASLMAKAGIFLPASGRPVIRWFDRIFADVGDSQSLEQNLSTFSGHIRRLCRIIKASSSQSLVLIDEIGGGTDPAEGSSLATAVLNYFSKTVSLCLVTTHSASLKTLPVHSDVKFENASVEFNLDTLRPTYRLLWGLPGQSNALNIAQSFQFDSKVIARANHWLTKLTPSGLKSRQSGLMIQLQNQAEEERSYADKATAYLADIQELHKELSAEAEDLDKRKITLKRQEVAGMNMQITKAKARMEEVISAFRDQGRNKKPQSLRAAQDAITAIVLDYSPKREEGEDSMPLPSVGERVVIRRLGKKAATVVEPVDSSGHLVVQLGTMKMRIKTSELVLSGLPKPAPTQVKRPTQAFSETPVGALEFAPVIQTSRNTVDVRGQSVEDAVRVVSLAIAEREAGAVIFIIHGIGTGILKQGIVSLLKRHPRVVRFEDESFVNGGCTVVYIK